MKVIIEIPKEFENHFDKDRFEDSLKRLSVDVGECTAMAGLYEIELCEMLIKAFINAEPVNDNWISVEDKLPDKSQRVLVFYKALGQENRIHNDVIASNWRTQKGDFIPCDGYKVTHWQPLPKPPKDGDKNEID